MPNNLNYVLTSITEREFKLQNLILYYLIFLTTKNRKCLGFGRYGSSLEDVADLDDLEDLDFSVAGVISTSPFVFSAFLLPLALPLLPPSDTGFSDAGVLGLPPHLEPLPHTGL
jgi:hypothetical protein